MKHTLYLILEPHRRWYNSPRIVAVKKRKPALKEGQAMVALDLEIKDDIFSPPRVPVVINEQNIVRPVPQVKAL